MNDIEALTRDQLASRLRFLNRARIGALILPFAGIAACMVGMAFGALPWRIVVIIIAACVVTFGTLNAAVDKRITAVLDMEERTAAARTRVPSRSAEE
ncbi:hypothetical protein GCM10025867_49770 (plasmid) [Frondihabitans sucicola]|uniref:Uncharacterized protein n=1 Tax=Frondihabitans sucicola TaxID=1268041 RepID=A0ABM8GW93_9MICO|nr:hypothetical protein [Frondihabitans sucicola]BDZ52736.1 hypothetical protein GCM10025867_49770 [Frondihabitans sucicola]